MAAQNKNHEEYKNLKGGNAEGHYHLTKAQYLKFRELIGLKGDPPVITEGQVITLQAMIEMSPYEVRGENCRI